MDNYQIDKSSIRQCYAELDCEHVWKSSMYNFGRFVFLQTCFNQKEDRRTTKYYFIRSDVQASFELHKYYKST